MMEAILNAANQEIGLKMDSKTTRAVLKKWSKYGDHISFDQFYQEVLNEMNQEKRDLGEGKKKKEFSGRR